MAAPPDPAAPAEDAKLSGSLSVFAGRVPPRTPIIVGDDGLPGVEELARGNSSQRSRGKSRPTMSLRRPRSVASEIGIDTRPGTQSVFWATFGPVLACCLSDADTHEERRRKALVVPACSCIALVSFVFAILYGYAVASTGPLRLSAAVSFVLACIHCVAFAVITKRLPVYLVEITGLWLLFTGIWCDIATAGMYEWWMAGMFIGNGLYLCEVRERVVVVSASLGACWIVIKTCEDAAGAFGIMESVPYNDNSRERYGWDTGFGVLTVRLSAHAIMFAVTRTFAESMRKERKMALAAVNIAQDSVRTAETVAAALVRFDLETAQAALVQREWEGPGSSSDLHSAFQNLLANLKVYRPYLPAALFAAHSETSEAVDQLTMSLPGTIAAAPHSPVDYQVSASASRESSGTLPAVDAGEIMNVCSPRRGFGLHTKACSILAANLCCQPGIRSPEDIRSHVDSFLDAVIGGAERAEGIVVSVKGQGGGIRVIVTWNAHRQQAAHAQQACVAAVGMAQQIRERRISNAVVAVTSGRALVGIVGSMDLRTPVLLGDALGLAESLACLADQLSCPVIADERIYDQARSVVAGRVIDAVRLRGGAERLVFELLPRADALNGPALELWVSAFGLLRQRNFTEARAKMGQYLESFKANDRQAKRLVRLMCILDANGVQSGDLYGRKQNEQWDDIEGSAIGPDAAPLTWSEDGTSKGASPGLSAGGGPADAWDARGDTQRLRKQIEKAHFETVRQGSFFHDGSGVPTHVVDARGRAWHRSTKRLGSGAFGEVWLGMGADGGFAALKSMRLPDTPGKFVDTAPDTSLGSGCETITIAEGSLPPGEVSVQTPVLPGKIGTMALQRIDGLIAEVKLLSHLRHDNIVEYLGSAVEAGFILIVMEYLPGGSLAVVLRQFANAVPKGPVRRYLRDIIQGLQFLHKEGMVHRDLKPHNVLVTIEGQCKLADFGASVELKTAGRSEEASMPAGTALYMAPEQVKGHAVPASDVWAAGIVLCEMAGGRHPWPQWADSHPFAIMFAVGSDDCPPPSFPDDMPTDALDLCQQCLRRDAARRPTAEDILNHPYLLK